jgi:hypothetical protein
MNASSEPLPPCSLPADINECARGTDDCSPDAACTNVNGTFVCACNDGFSGDGRACTDSRPPNVTVADGGRPVYAFAAPGATGAPAAFPTILKSDTVSPASAIVVVCTAVVAAGGSAPVEVFSGATAFPVGTTTVACVGTDAAGNKSPPASFSVVVRCQPDYTLNGAGVCTGERRH